MLTSTRIVKCGGAVTQPSPRDAIVSLREVVELSHRRSPAVYGLARVTPCIPSRRLSAVAGGAVVLKAECLQRTGAFKIRGAVAKLDALGSARSRGVIAASAGNHGQAIARAARHFGVEADVFVPKTASPAKVAACREYGASVHEVGDSVEHAIEAAIGAARDTGRALCHPYDDIEVIAGQATIGSEIADQLPDVTQVIVPLGGGGLLAGIASAARRLIPRSRVVGVEVEGWTPYKPDARSRTRQQTLADGIAVSQRGEVSGPLIERYVDDVVVVTEDSVAAAMALLLERSKLCVEGAGAVGVAAILSGQVVPSPSGTTCVVLSGGNVDLGPLAGIIRLHETTAGRRAILCTRLEDRPGSLAGLLSLVGQQSANVLDVMHVRDGVGLHAREASIRLVIELKDGSHASRLLDALREENFDAWWISDDERT